MTQQPHAHDGNDDPPRPTNVQPSRDRRIRRLNRTLNTARAIRGDLAVALAQVPDLDDNTVDRARRISRTYSVQMASMRHSSWFLGYTVIRVVSALLMVVAPVAFLAPIYLAMPRASQVVAAALYFVFLGVLAGGWRFRQGTVAWPRTIVVWSALALLIALTDILGPRSWQTSERRGLWLAALGAAASLALVAVRFVAVVWLRDHHIRPLAFRAASGPLPAHLVTVRLLVLVSSLHQARFSWWHPRQRRDLLEWMVSFRTAVTWELRGCARDAGLGAISSEQSARRARHLTGVLRQVESRLLDADDPEDFRSILADLLKAFQAIARGDWSPLTLAEEPPVKAGRLLSLLRRVVPAVVLIVAALLLPLLPGRPATTGAAVATVQLGLFVAAALSLLPIDADVRSRVVEAYATTGRISP